MWLSNELGLVSSVFSEALGMRPAGMSSSAGKKIVVGREEDFLSGQLPRGVAAADGAGWDAQSGMSTAEYAVGTIAAVAFAAVLIAIARSDWAHSTLQAIFERALTVE